MVDVVAAIYTCAGAYSPYGCVLVLYMQCQQIETNKVSCSSLHINLDNFSDLTPEFCFYISFHLVSIKLKTSCRLHEHDMHFRLCHKAKEGFAVTVDGLCLALHFLHIL